MTKERTFETGGEVLRVGSVVTVFDGNSQKDLAVTEIGPKRIFIESRYSLRPVPYSRETRQSLQGAYPSYFRTKTEVAEDQERTVAKSRLRDLGVEARLTGPGKDGLDPYPIEILRQVADVLDAALPNSQEPQQG